MLVESSPRKLPRHTAGMCVPQLHVAPPPSPSHPMSLRALSLFSSLDPSLEAQARHFLPRAQCPWKSMQESPDQPDSVPSADGGIEAEWKGAGLRGRAPTGCLAQCWLLSSHYTVSERLGVLQCSWGQSGRRPALTSGVYLHKAMGLPWKASSLEWPPVPQPTHCLGLTLLRPEATR